MTPQMAEDLPLTINEDRQTCMGERFRVTVFASDFVYANGEVSEAGHTASAYALNDAGHALDAAIAAGDFSAWRRYQREIWREPNTSEGMLAEAGEWIAANASDALAGGRFMRNPGGRPPFAPEGVEPHQYRADSIARVLEEIQKRDGQRGAVIAALSTVHISTPLVDEAAARTLAHKDQREFDLEDVLRKWWDRNKPS